jgi:hypothetical protein
MTRTAEHCPALSFPLEVVVRAIRLISLPEKFTSFMIKEIKLPAVKGAFTRLKSDLNHFRMFMEMQFKIGVFNCCARDK